MTFIPILAETRDAYLPYSQAMALMSLLGEIRETFDQHFDRSWIATAIDGLPMEQLTIRGIRQMTAIGMYYPGVEPAIEAGLDDLDVFITELRRRLLPFIKERFKISPLRPDAKVVDPELYIYRRLSAFALPFNLDRLESLSRRLRGALQSARGRATVDRYLHPYRQEEYGTAM